ncbi:unnamed protein product [Effrenium voratum]|uniref:Uncharacterized protein n=1 Tax=Effrenium voratum TaxID=2562239 RepID=A0AA36HQ32_9DINO|nr:unnamed protein product [Effrenium voratum]CAJ1412225.1 unnamed protein product [Effrenium voratum]
MEVPNDLLRSLHFERLRRAKPEEATDEEKPAKAETARAWRISLQEVVCCQHGPNARCLQCSGRAIPDVPESAYVSFHEAYAEVPHFLRPSDQEVRALKAGHAGKGPCPARCPSAVSLPERSTSPPLRPWCKTWAQVLDSWTWAVGRGALWWPGRCLGRRAMPPASRSVSCCTFRPQRWQSDCRPVCRGAFSSIAAISSSTTWQTLTSSW